MILELCSLGFVILPAKSMLEIILYTVISLKYSFEDLKGGVYLYAHQLKQFVNEFTRIAAECPLNVYEFQ